MRKMKMKRRQMFNVGAYAEGVSKDTLITEWGELLHLEPFAPKNKLSFDAIAVHDNSKAEEILDDLNRYKEYILYSPEMHHANALTINSAVKSKIIEQYYGLNKRRGKSPFMNCNNSKEIFNMNRRVKANISFTINRMGFAMFNTGTLRIKGYPPQSKIFETLIEQRLEEYRKKEENRFRKPDFFISANYFEAIIAADNLSSSGIEISYLNNKKIYPQFGVWSPTKQDYLKLLHKYLQNNSSMLSKGRAVDLGCGTGVLSILLKEAGVDRVVAIDSNPKSIECTKFNAQVHGYSEYILPVLFDLQQYLPSKQTSQAKKSIANPAESLSKIEGDYDIIVANPPWIAASHMNSLNPIENGVYDPEETMLKASFNFASKHSNTNTRFLLVYSDLGELIGLQEPNRIEGLCREHKMSIMGKWETKLPMSQKEIDPLKNVKKDANVILYEIKKN